MCTTCSLTQTFTVTAVHVLNHKQTGRDIKHVRSFFYQPPIKHVSHTFQSWKSSGKRSKVGYFPAGGGHGISESNLSQNEPTRGLNTRRFILRFQCHIPAVAQCASTSNGSVKSIHSQMMTLNVKSPLAI